MRERAETLHGPAIVGLSALGLALRLPYQLGVVAAMLLLRLQGPLTGSPLPAANAILYMHLPFQCDRTSVELVPPKIELLD